MGDLFCCIFDFAYDLFFKLDKIKSRLLAVNKISLVNIHILEIREDIDGILQLTFIHEKDLLQAEKVLSAGNYVTLRNN